MGASGQAGLSALAVKRFVAWPNKLESLGEISAIALIGGPVGCLVNSTWGTLTLYLAGAIQADALKTNGVAWWAGDTMGALCF